MRIQFSLVCPKGTIIPINYQSEISQWIFEVLSKAGSELNLWMQQHGYDLGMRNFKLFTFSPLAIYPYEMDQARQEFKLLGNQVKLSVSMFLPQVFEQQIIHLFRQVPLMLGTCEGRPAHFEVKHWQVASRPTFKETMQFRAVSPVSVTTVDEVRPPNPYLLPDTELYDVSFFHHLVRRFKAAVQYRSLANMKLLDPAFGMHYRMMGQAKSRLIHLKPNAEGVHQLRGFTFEFEVSASPPTLEFGYYAGFGEFPHLGFGYVEIK
jgi:CRISPR-associated endoribonuclease Cas6